MFKLHKICQFRQFIFIEIIKIVAPNSILVGAPPQTVLPRSHS